MTSQSPLRRCEMEVEHEVQIGCDLAGLEETRMSRPGMVDRGDIDRVDVWPRIDLSIEASHAVATVPPLGQPTGAPRLLGVDTWGTYAEFVKVPASTVQIVPDALDFITAAVVGRHGPLAFTQLRDRAQVSTLAAS